jgi:hypothetical protein
MSTWFGRWISRSGLASGSLLMRVARYGLRQSSLAISFATSSASNLRASKSCVHPFRVSRLCSVLADAWVFQYTDFGESHESLGRPVLRASFPVGVPGGLVSFSALVDTGGPITLVAHDVVEAVGGDAVDTGETLPIRIGGRSFAAPLYELTLEARPPEAVIASPMPWRGLVGVLSPFPHHGTSIILGQIGFLENFTVTFGPEGFAVEPAASFEERFGPPA